MDGRTDRPMETVCVCVYDLKQQRYRFYAKPVNHAQYIVPLSDSNLLAQAGAAAEWIFGIYEICVLWK